jgi:DNA-binding cell septation regulator SpoVG
MSVEISEIRIFRVLGSATLKAYVNVTLGVEYAIHGLKVMAREDGTLWVSMPRQKSASDGQWRMSSTPSRARRGSVSSSVC